MSVDRQPINQFEADEIVRILITVNPGMRASQIMRAAMGEGLPMDQAQKTAAKYLGWDGRERPTRCVEHNAVLPCGSCSR